MIYRTSKLHPHTHMIKINDCWFETTQQHILQQFESMSELWLMINSRNQQFILVTKHNSFWEDINECWYFSMSCKKIILLSAHHHKFIKENRPKIQLMYKVHCTLHSCSRKCFNLIWIWIFVWWHQKGRKNVSIFINNSYDLY